MRKKMMSLPGSREKRNILSEIAGNILNAHDGK
jgi:hypothetical protein